MNEILLEDTIKLLDYYFNRDEKYPDLWELINSSSYSFEYHPIGFLSQFYYKKKHIILPDILLDQYKSKIFDYFKLKILFRCTVKKFYGCFSKYKSCMDYNR